MSKKNILLCGVGGQGTVLASKLIAYAAMKKGYFARTAETIGMAQRGGSVVSHVRIGHTIYSPMIPKKSADVIVGFEPAEAVRCLPYLKENGIVIVSNKPIRPVTASLGFSYDSESVMNYLMTVAHNVITIDAEQIFHDCGSSKVLNVALLGAASQSGALGLTIDELKDAINHIVPEKYHALNHKALSFCTRQISP